MTRPRSGAGTAAQAGWAPRAARHVAVKAATSAPSTSVTRSERSAGLREVIVGMGLTVARRG